MSHTVCAWTVSSEHSHGSVDVFQDKMILLGGLKSIDFEYFDEKWTVAGQINHETSNGLLGAIYDHTSAVLGQHLYVFGGKHNFEASVIILSYKCASWKVWMRGVLLSRWRFHHLKDHRKSVHANFMWGQQRQPAVASYESKIH